MLKVVLSAGELLIVGLESSPLDSESIELLDEVRPLGVILFARNMPDRDTLERLVADLLERDPGGIVAVDHEGGRVDRLPAGFTKFPPALHMARCGDPGLLREVGLAQARELRAVGFNVNFAPCLDIHTNPDNPIIGDRAFGSTPEEVSHHAIPYMQGLAEGGMISCGKHFPGHGDTDLDSHHDLPFVRHDKGRLMDVEMRPFAQAINQGVPMIMSAHVVYPALDEELPASLSPKVIKEHLRARLKFGGVIVSDDLEMSAVSARYTMEDTAAMAVNAGSDVLLVCKTPALIREAHGGLSRRIQEGELDAGQLAGAAKRIKKLKGRIRKNCRIPTESDVIGCEEHNRLLTSVS